MLPTNDKPTTSSNFIKSHITKDLENGKLPNNKVVLRFPPEPNGYLHLGHAKSIILNSSLAEEFNGELNLRFDDTNPEKENAEYVNAIKEDAFWLNSSFTKIVWASDYFDTIYECALYLIENNLAYIDNNDIETIRSLRGDFNHAGTNSIYRDRSIEENHTLFTEMKHGVFKDGEMVLRAKIDMSHPNLNMRDPILYRIKHAHHHNTGDKWCIYPMYDFAHAASDAIEGITHSLCTMEFEDHRVLYDWVIENCYPILKSRPTQIEFARLDMEGVMLSKRKLNTLIENGSVDNWSNPVMPTISGLRNRGLTPPMLYDFITRCGITKSISKIEKFVLEDCIRDNLNPIAPRTMAIINPVLLEIENFDNVEIITLPNHPKNTELGSREVNLSNRLWVDLDDVRATAEKDFWRIYPGNTVRLKHGYNIYIKDVIVENGVIVKVIAEADLGSKNPKEAKTKAKVALHWLNVEDCVNLPVNFYNTLCDENGIYLNNAVTTKMVKVEKNVLDSNAIHYEFERVGYFYVNKGVGHCLSPLKKN